MKRQFKLASLLLASLLSVFTIYSCSNSVDENLEILKEREEQKVPISAEALALKKKVAENVQQKQTRNPKSEFTESQIKEMRIAALDFLKSEGFEESDYGDFMEEGDPRLVLYASFYLGMLEADPNELYYAEESTRNCNKIHVYPLTCYNAAKVIDCIMKAVGDFLSINDLREFISGACITIPAGKAIFKAILKKFPWIAGAVALESFCRCMGWLDWLYECDFDDL